MTMPRRVEFPTYEMLLTEAIRSLAVDSGMVTSPAPVGTNLLSDETKNWAANVHRNRLVKIVRGAGAGQMAVIDNNVAKSLIIKQTWLKALDTTSFYVIVDMDLAQVLRDVFGGGADISVTNPLQVFDPKVWGAGISYQGITSGDGNTAGTTLVCADLDNWPAYLNCPVKIMSGPAIGQVAKIIGKAAGGILTVSSPFQNASGAAQQIATGTNFCILSGDGQLSKVIASGIFTTSSALSPVDNTRTEGADYFNGCILVPLTGAVAYQPRRIQTFWAGGLFNLYAGSPFTAAPGLVPYVILADVDYTAGTISKVLTPQASLYEGWQNEAGIDPAVWTLTNPATGAAWTRSLVASFLRAYTSPNANETARMVSNQRWRCDCAAVTGALFPKTILEFEISLSNWTNLDNSLCIFGLTANPNDDRSSQNVIAIILSGDNFACLTDSAGSETVTPNMPNVGRNLAARIEVNPNGWVKFYSQGNLFATHTTNLPSGPKWINFFIDTEAGGAATLRLGIVRCWTEDIIL